MKRLKGFTLLEMLLSMVLSMLVIGFAYFGINYLYSSYINYQKINDHIQQQTKLENYFDQLFRESSEIKMEGETIVFVKPDKSKIIGSLNPEFILFDKENTSIDTVYLPVKEFSVYWNNEILENKRGFVNKIEIKSTFGENDFTSVFEKNYDAVSLMRLDSLRKTQFE